MKAILIQEKGKAENLVIKDYPTPIPQKGFVLVKNRAFGINRAEIYMRKGEWGETHEIIGIEFAGEVVDDPGGTFKKGQKVVSFVGGLAREFGGSYAEYVCLPAQNLIPVETNLPWNELAAIPESFITAWSILNQALQVKADQSILVRGATSTIGLASIILGKQLNLKVIATSRSIEKEPLLRTYGADYFLIDNGTINEQLKHILPGGVDNAVELVGTTTLNDTLACMSNNGTVCVAGFLGGLAPLENFMPLIQIPSTVKLTSYGSAFVIGSKDFPYSEIPVQQIISDIENGKIKNILSKTFAFEEIIKVHQLMESNSVNGKIVVTL